MRYKTYSDAKDDIWPKRPLQSPDDYKEAKPPVIEGTKPGQMITFSGPSGTGKTNAVWGLVNKYAESSKPYTLFINESWLMSYIWDNFALDAILFWPEILIIDDIGYRCHADQMPHEWLQHCAYSIANHRSSYRLTTIWTTNLSMDRMRNAYGQMVASRVFGGRVITVGGKDRRLK